jgi:hypothetical protein
MGICPNTHGFQKESSFLVLRIQTNVLGGVPENPTFNAQTAVIPPTTTPERMSFVAVKV